MKHVIALSLVAAMATGVCTAGGPSGVAPNRTDQILQVARDRVTTQGDAWFSDGDYPRDIQSLRLLHELFPSDYDLATSLGWMLENVHDYGKALAVYIGYREANPHDPEAVYPEAWFYFRQKLYAKVPTLLEPALSYKVHAEPNTYRILASAYERMGLYGDSVRIWQRYLKLYPGDPQAAVNEKRVTSKMKG